MDTKRLKVNPLFFFFSFDFFQTRFLSIDLTILELISVHQTGLELKDSPAFASKVLRLKSCSTTPGSEGGSSWLKFLTGRALHSV